jgi:hypothetical protein
MTAALGDLEADFSVSPRAHPKIRTNFRILRIFVRKFGVTGPTVVQRSKRSAPVFEPSRARLKGSRS